MKKFQITNSKLQANYNNKTEKKDKLQTICPLHIAELQISSLFMGRDGVIGKPKIRLGVGFVILVIGIWNLFVICDL
jgi:hypothetical protein